MNILTLYFYSFMNVMKLKILWGKMKVCFRYFERCFLLNFFFKLFFGGREIYKRKRKMGRFSLFEAELNFALFFRQ